KAIMARWDRRVGREDASRPHSGDALGPQGAPGDFFFEEAQCEQWRMTLVHVERDHIAVPELAQHRDAAETEDSLLAEAMGVIAPVQLVGNAAVGGLVQSDVGVE